MKKLFPVVLIVLIAVHINYGQVTAKSSEVGIGGGLFMGDYMTDDNIIELNNGFAPFVRYGYNFNERLALEGFITYVATDVSIEVPEDLLETPAWYMGNEEEYVGIDVMTQKELDAHFGAFDLSFLYHITPKRPEVLYVGGGMGYTITDIDRIEAGKNSFSGNVVTGVKFYFAESAVLRVEGKYRYIDKALCDGDSLSTFEFNVGVSWVFD